MVNVFLSENTDKKVWGAVVWVWGRRPPGKLSL